MNTRITPSKERRMRDGVNSLAMLDVELTG
jgi:hypothetical protein